ncbi:porin [Kaistia dalseonensis]|uniref:Porin n=1 Tax=Kaistia dalseonensis TaxID=410840 RepID=A0ABU0H1D7_9HYPH|nr:porin [Kaistia dalseonensis]MCX5493568.1 porin [Kaistia dalseonensis]MDQ0436128.1 hypothetical protein [Kaistia dalseonensis]
MNFKTLLLGSAAAMIVAGGAQAADLTVAEPVDYVKVCDAFGTGFFYSPGTDTCIKVGGYVKFGTSFGDTDFGQYNSTYPGSSWSNFYTEASIQLTASSITEYGNLTGFLDYRAQTGNTGGFSQSLTQVENASTNSAYVDSAYLELGPIKAGRFTSLFDFGRGYGDTGGFGSDSTVDHIQLTYAVNGFGLAVSIEDQRDRGAAAGYDNAYLNPYYVTGGQDNVPDIVAAVTYTSGIFSAKVAGAYVNEAISYGGGNGSAANPFEFNAESGWAVGGGLEVALDSFSAGDKFFVSAAYGDNANSYTGIAGGTSVAGISSALLGSTAGAVAGTSWSAMASYKHVWTPQLWSSLTGSYADFDGDGHALLSPLAFDGSAFNAWRGVFDIGYTPVKGLDMIAEGIYNKVSSDDAGLEGDSWAVNLWMKRSW